MRYCYCPKCDIVRPKRRFGGDRCEVCQDECVPIDVPRTKYGYIMYALDAVAIVMIALYIAHHNFSAEFASFVGSVDETLYIVVMFGLIFVSFAFAALDIGRTQEEALRIARERRGRVQ